MKQQDRKIFNQLKYIGLKPNAFIAGVGTGGTVMGVGRFLKQQDAAIQVHPLEPANSPTLTTGHKVGSHRIQGISDEFIPSIVELNKLDNIICVDDGDAIVMAQKLAEIGLGVGISSGANFIGALKVHEKLGTNSVVVTIFPDDNKKYLSTDLLKKEPVKSDFYSTNVNLLEFRTYKRPCFTCCDPDNCHESEYFSKNGFCTLPQCPARLIK